MLWPLLACFVLVGIHSYLGIHVIARKVIFVDLALAQIAGLGAVYGVFVGLSFETDSLLIKGVSILFTLGGAAVFSFTRTHDEDVPHEAIIGIIYAAALSLTLLLTANLPHGADEVRQLLAGNILWVTPSDVMSTAALYGVIGFIHVICRKQFFLLSNAHQAAHTSLNVKLWDFFFYATFGVVVTSSVGMGGILLVFGYLVIPSVIAVMLARGTKQRLIIGWSSGLLMSVVGVVVSYHLDLPSGPTIVVMLALLLLLISVMIKIVSKSSRTTGLVHLVVVSFVIAVLVILPRFDFHQEQEHEHSKLHELSHDNSDVSNALKASNTEQVLAALSSIKERRLVHLVLEVVPLLSSTNDRVRELAASTLKELADPRAREGLKQALLDEQDPFIAIELAEALLSIGDETGLFALQKIMNDSDSEFAKNDAMLHLRERLVNPPENREALSSWLTAHKNNFRFDKDTSKFFIAEDTSGKARK